MQQIKMKRLGCLNSWLLLKKQGLAAPTFEHPLKEVNQNQIVKNFGEFIADNVTVEDLEKKILKLLN